MSFPTKYDLIDAYCNELGLWASKDGQIARSINGHADAKQELRAGEWSKVLAAEVGAVKRSKVLDAMAGGRLCETELAAELSELSPGDVTKYCKAARMSISDLLSRVQDDTPLYGGYWSRSDELNRLARIGRQLFGGNGPE